MNGTALTVDGGWLAEKSFVAGDAAGSSFMEASETAKLTTPGPRQNRVTPFSELIADPGRGLVYGNRGCLHDEHGQVRRRYNGKRWIACRLAFKGWHRKALMQPGKFTEFFFLDEATAFAAGHRPCALCRREDYTAFLERWALSHPGMSRADDIDAVLHHERVDVGSRRQRTHRAELDDLPNGAFVVWDDEPHLVLGDRLRRWTPAGYDVSALRPAGTTVTMLTPPSLVEVIRRRVAPGGAVSPPIGARGVGSGLGDASAPDPVASTQPPSTSAKPTIIPAVRCSPSTATPSTAATAGFTYVITVARTGPTSAIRAKKTMNASAVQIVASPITERIT